MLAAPGRATLRYDTAGQRKGAATRYLLRDHLGGVHALVNPDGPVQAMAFGPWGRRRGAGDWADLSKPAQASASHTNITARGFTAHEMLDAAGLVHMNGRIYDPELGRFLQADPFIQFLAHTQGHNRYSYVLNNPTSLTDPSGYFVFSLSAMLFVAAQETVKWYVAAAVLGAGGFADALAQGAGFEQALLSGIISGVSGAAFSGIGSHLATHFGGGFAAGLSAGGFALKVGLHGTVGGIAGALQGGRFGHGFAAAGLTALGSGFNNSRFVGGPGFSPARVTVAAAVGGTASRITGGKFANGAVTGAFSQALNNEATEAKAQERRSLQGLRSPTEFQERYEDILKAVNIDLQVNIDKAKKMSLTEFKAKVTDEEGWDWKNRRELEEIDPALREEFGNVHFGIVAAAWGFDLSTSLWGAGLYQVFGQEGGSLWHFMNAPAPIITSNEGAAFWTRMGFTWGDNPGDAVNIMHGWQYYDKHY